LRLLAHRVQGGRGDSVAGEAWEAEAGRVTARAHLHVVREGGEVAAEDVCLGCVELSKKIAHLSGELTKLRNQQEQVERRDPLDGQVLEVCVFHKQLLSPTWKIVRKKGAYNDVRDRLRDVDAETGGPAFTPLHLKAASVGLSINDWARGRSIKSASWLFGKTAHVQWMLDTAVQFKRELGTSALRIVDELGRPGLEKLAASCSCCSHLRLDHERERPELDLWDPPCAVHGCACPGFDDFDWRVRVRMAELERERVAS
jgi:hypothetical protein